MSKKVKILQEKLWQYRNFNSSNYLKNTSLKNKYYSDSTIKYSLDKCIDRNDILGFEILYKLLKMTKRKRKRVFGLIPLK